VANVLLDRDLRDVDGKDKELCPLLVKKKEGWSLYLAFWLLETLTGLGV
jgi:hypothetical protein